MTQKKSKDTSNPKRLLTSALDRFAKQPHTIEKNGDTITKAEALAGLLWDYALGFTYTDVKTGKDMVERPKAWAIQLIYDRLEGKVPMQSEAGTAKPTASEKISGLSKTKINQLTEETE